MKRLIRRKDFLAASAATLLLTGIGCQAMGKGDENLSSEVYLVYTDRFPEKSYIVGYNSHLLRTTTTVLDVRGLGDSTCGFARIDHEAFIPVYGGYAATDNRIAAFDLDTQGVRFITSESEPVDVVAWSEYLYVAHRDGPPSTLSKIRSTNGVTMKRTKLEGIASRMFLNAEHIYVFCERPVPPASVVQTIYILDFDLNIKRTLTNPYSSICNDVLKQGSNLIIANYQSTIGMTDGSPLISLHPSTGYVRPILKPPSRPVKLFNHTGDIYLACESGEIMLLGKDYSKMKKVFQVRNLSGGCIKGDILYCIDGLNDQFYAIDLRAKRFVSQVKIPRPKYQTAAVLIFPANG